MKVTYIGHSGFMAETQNHCLLFDYYTGEIPDINKKYIVFASHFHNDHFNPAVFDLAKKHNVTYILSWEIKRGFAGIDIHYVKANEKIEADGIFVETLKSTDEGVAFIVGCDGKAVYHSGDLNLWVWSGETKAYNNNMRANFYKYTEPLKGRTFDVGFIPLDPRQGEDYCAGMDSFLAMADFKAVFPMHFWKKYSIIKKYKQEKGAKADNVKIIEFAGQQWEV